MIHTAIHRQVTACPAQILAVYLVAKDLYSKSCLRDRHQLFKPWGPRDTCSPGRAGELVGLAVGSCGSHMPGSREVPRLPARAAALRVSLRKPRDTALRPDLSSTHTLCSRCLHTVQTQHSNLVWCDQGFYSWGKTGKRGRETCRHPVPSAHVSSSQLIPCPCLYLPAALKGCCRAPGRGKGNPGQVSG